MTSEEGPDSRHTSRERRGQLSIWRVPDDHQQCHPMANHGRQLIGLVANSTVVGQGHPTSGAYHGQPVLVARVWWEMVAVPLDREPRRSQDVGEPGTEITIGEEDMAQAVRS